MYTRLLFGNDSNERADERDDAEQNVSIARQLVAENPTIIIVVASGVGFVGSALHTFGFSSAWGVRLWTLITPGDYLMQAVPLAGFLAGGVLFVLLYYVFYLSLLALIWALVGLLAFPFFVLFWGAYRAMRGADMDDEEETGARANFLSFFASAFGNITSIVFVFLWLPLTVLFSSLIILASFPGEGTIVYGLLTLIASLIYFISAIIGLFVMKGSIATRVRKSLRQVGFFAVAVAFLFVLPIYGADDFYAAQYTTSKWDRPTHARERGLFGGQQNDEGTGDGASQAGDDTAAPAQTPEPKAEEESEPGPQPLDETDATSDAESEAVADNNEFAIELHSTDFESQLPRRERVLCEQRPRQFNNELRFEEACLLRSLERGVLYIDSTRQKVIFDVFDEQINIELCYPKDPPEEWADFELVRIFLLWAPFLGAAYEFYHPDVNLETHQTKSAEELPLFASPIDCQDDS